LENGLFGRFSPAERNLWNFLIRSFPRKRESRAHVKTAGLLLGPRFRGDERTLNTDST